MSLTLLSLHPALSKSNTETYYRYLSVWDNAWATYVRYLDSATASKADGGVGVGRILSFGEWMGSGAVVDEGGGCVGGVCGSVSLGDGIRSAAFGSSVAQEERAERGFDAGGDKAESGSQPLGENLPGDGTVHMGGVAGSVAGSGVRCEGDAVRGKHYAKNRAKKEKQKKMKAEARLKREKMQGSWRGYCETVASEKPSSVPSSCPGLSSATTSQSLIDAEAAARESLAKRRVVENELAMAKARAQIASYADVEKSKAIAELKIARIAQWNNEARMKSQKSWADYKRSLESSPVPSFKASDLPSAASAGEYWWKQQCLKSKEMEEQIKHLEAIIKASMPYVSPEGLEKMREVPDPEPVIDPEFEALKRAHRELAAAEGLDGYDSGDDIGYDLFMPPGSL